MQRTTIPVVMVASVRREYVMPKTDDTVKASCLPDPALPAAGSAPIMEAVEGASTESARSAWPTVLGVGLVAMGYVLFFVWLGLTNGKTIPASGDIGMAAPLAVPVLAAVGALVLSVSVIARRGLSVPSVVLLASGAVLVVLSSYVLMAIAIGLGAP